MNEQIRDYISRFPEEIIDMFDSIRQIIFDSSSNEPREELWAKLPSFYVGEAFVRLIPFKDHINIESEAIASHKVELDGYKITPKGMLPIFLGQKVPADMLSKIFRETLDQI